MAQHSANTRFEAHLICKELLHVTMNCIDSRDLDRAVESFAENGYVMRRGERADGPEAIKTLLEDRPPEHLTRHHCTNFVFNWNGKDVASATCYLLLFTGTLLESGEKSWKPAALIDYAIEYVLTNDEWCIKSLSAQAVGSL